jgi:hypothetical protein
MKKGLGARWSSGLGLAGIWSIGKQEVHEVFRERLDDSGSKRVRA